jgi:hypothetical protein
MTKDEIYELARATCSWLAYKDLTGFQRILSEAALTLPIAEFLTARTSWLLQPELYYQKIPGAKWLPEFWCDFAGTRKGGGGGVQFLLEAKYLKSKAEGVRRNIATDFIRLCLPPGKAIKRYFLLAGQSNYFPESDSELIFDRKLFGLEVGRGCYIYPAQELAKPYLTKLSSTLGGDGENGLASKVLKSAYLTCRAVEEVRTVQDRKYKVMIWSIGLTKQE